MSTGGSTPEHWNCGDDAAAYALGALSATDAAAFRRHLETCIVCGDESAAFRQIVDALAMSVPQHPLPRGLRRRIMREVHAEGSAPVPRTGRHTLRFRFPRWLVARPALAGAVLGAAVVALIGGLQLAPGDSTATRIIRAQVSGPADGARLSVTGARAELIVNHLAPPPAGRVYEVWVERPHHGPSPRALFSVTASGTADVRVPGDVRGASTVTVTEERAGGSLQPTQPPVIVAKLV